MKTVALVIAEKTFRDEEYQVPKLILEQAGIKVLTVCTTLEIAVGKLGMEVKPDLLLKDLDKIEIDALIFVGGGGSSQYFLDKHAHELLWYFYNQGKIIGAICIAPVILANAGILKGKKATVFPDGKEQLLAAGAIYSDHSVETDEKIITGCGPEAAEQYGRELLKLLNK